MPVEHVPDCDTCAYHQTELYRMSQAEKDISGLSGCYKELKKDIAALDKKHDLLHQKYDNIRYPIWIIFGAVLIELAKALVTFGPSISTVAGVLK